MITARTVFCDDIRIENNGKFILIGVYSGRINVSQHSKLSLGTWVEVAGVSAGTHNANLWVHYFPEDGSEGEVVGAMRSPITIHDPSLPVALGPSGLAIPTINTGRIAVFLGIEGFQQVFAGDIIVKVMDPVAPAFPRPTAHG